MKLSIHDVILGDIVRFVSYSLRVENEPIRANNSITLQGRTNVAGSPIVTKRFIGPRIVSVERKP